MATASLQKPTIWELVKLQHGVVSRRQLLDAGLSEEGIRQRMKRGRLFKVRRGVYAVGRRELSQYGRWMAALLACGRLSVLSHRSAAALWRIEREGGLIDISVPSYVRRALPGIRLHRRDLPPEEIEEKAGLRLTGPDATIIDLAQGLSIARLERAINTADSLGLTDPERLRVAAGRAGGRRGAPALRRVMDSRTFRRTDSGVERRFLALVRRAGLPLPLTQQSVNGFRVDFYWPDSKLVVETDSLTYHRTPAEQARDRLRDQAHIAAGLTPLRIPESQLKNHPAAVTRLLTQLVSRA